MSDIDLLRTGEHTAYVTISGATAVNLANLIEAQQIKIEQLRISGNNLSFNSYHHEDCDSFWMTPCTCGISKYITAWNEISYG